MPDYDYVVYLDGDMVCLQDIYSLNEQLGFEELIAATRDYCGNAACYDPESDRLRYRTSFLGDFDINNYVISCLIIYNVKKFNKLFVPDYVANLAQSNNWLQHDQDVLNLLCKNDIKYISPKWALLDELSYTKKFLPDSYFEEYYNAKCSPHIVHFAADKKAWLNKKSDFNQFFWKEAYKTEYFSILIDKIREDLAYKYYLFNDILKRPIDYLYADTSIILCSSPYMIGYLSKFRFSLNFIKIEKNTIRFSGYFETINFNGTCVKLFVVFNNEKINIQLINGDEYSEGYGVAIKKFECSFSLTGNATHIKFSLTYDEQYFFEPDYVAVDQFTPINESPYSYYVSDTWCLQKISNGTELLLTNSFNPHYLERKLLKDLKTKSNKQQLIQYRRLYKFLNFFFKKKYVILYMESYSDIKFIEQLRRIYPGHKIVLAGDHSIPNVMRLGSKKYQFYFTLSKAIASPIYHYLVFFPFTSFTRADEIRDLIADIDHVIIKKDGDESILDSRYYKVTAIIR